MTLKDNNHYFKILIVRKGDIQASKKGIQTGMLENEVYFVDNYQIEFNKISDLLTNYLKILQSAD